MAPLAAFVLSAIIAFIVASLVSTDAAPITFAITLTVLFLVFKRKQQKQPASNKAKTTNKEHTAEQQTEVFAWPNLSKFEFEVVDESYYQETLEKLVEHAKTESNDENNVMPTFTAYLIPDDTNENDDKAVRVDINGAQVGNLSRENARSFRRRLRAKKLSVQITSCQAIITGIGNHEQDGQEKHYSVKLNIKPFI